jgi:hypothetical protein
LPSTPGAYLVYLDVWERHLTALDDPALREVALGGPDTTTRVQTVWQVRAVPLAAPPVPADVVAALFESLISVIVEIRAAARGNAALSQGLQQLGERIRAQLNEILPPNPPRPIESVDARQVQAMLAEQRGVVRGFFPIEPEPLAARVRELETTLAREIATRFPAVSCDSPLAEWSALTAPRDGALRARATPEEDEEGPCLLPPGAGYRRLENQLYRVEIHAGGRLSADSSDPVSFKWSRENGVVVTAVRLEGEPGEEPLSMSIVPVEDVGPDAERGFASSQLVEILDAGDELLGQAGELRTIVGVDAAARTIELDAPVSLDPRRQPRLRRWDGPGLTTARLPANDDDYLGLEDGVEVQFAPGSYAAGDYWLIPARTVTGDVEWPVDATGSALVLAGGGHHRFARLALVRFDGMELVVADDCRVILPSLADLTPPEAIHVTETSWENDDLFALDQLIDQGARGGLRIRLDAAPHQAALNPAAISVVLEQPPGAPLVLDGLLDAPEPRLLRWNPSQATIALLRDQVTANRRPRLRVTLHGHVIWSGVERPIYLDGRAFGTPAIRADGSTMRIDLALPSGDAARTSDFESWLYLDRAAAPARPPQVGSLEFIAGNLFSLERVVASASKDNLRQGTAVRLRTADNVSTLELSFTQPVTLANPPRGGAPGIRIERLEANNRRTLVPATFTLHGTTARLALVVSGPIPRPQPFPDGSYLLTVIGDPTRTSPAVQGADQVRFDGDYDGQPGGDLAVPFVISDRFVDTRPDFGDVVIRPGGGIVFNPRRNPL